MRLKPMAENMLKTGGFTVSGNVASKRLSDGKYTVYVIEERGDSENSKYHCLVIDNVEDKMVYFSIGTPFFDVMEHLKTYVSACDPDLYCPLMKTFEEMRDCMEGD